MPDTQDPQNTQTPEPSSIFRTYLNHKIELTSTLEFRVSGPQFEHLKDHYCTFPSLNEAKIKIDDEVNAAIKIRAQNIKFKETILTETGEPKTITGISRVTGRLNGTEINERYVFPNLPNIRELLVKKDKLSRELDTLDDRLRKFQIYIQRTHRRIDPHRYAEFIENLQTEINQKRELAAAETQEPQANDPGSEPSEL